MDIEVGDYVRTRSGEIFKVKEVNPTIGGKIAIVRKENGFIRRVDMEEEKHSKNIIDLIKVGDFVNGYRVLEMFKFQNDKYAFTICKSDFKSICGICSEEDIETILTKEQYSQNCYTVERS